MKSISHSSTLVLFSLGILLSTPTFAALKIGPGDLLLTASVGTSYDSNVNSNANGTSDVRGTFNASANYDISRKYYQIGGGISFNLGRF